MRPAMPRMAVILALLAIGGLLTACASSNSPATTTVVRPAAATGARAAAGTETPAGAEKPLTKAQALAFAHAVNLTAADVPGFKVSSEHHERETPAEKRSGGELTRCAGGVGSSHQVAEASSKEFERESNSGAQNAQSGVTVEQTPALAAKELAAVRSARGRACLSHYVTLLFQGQKYEGASVGPVSIASGSPHAPGTTGGFGLRITATITLHHIKIPFYMDFLGFVYGPTEVMFRSFSLPEPFPAATEERLFSLLLTRAKSRAA
jgi:hypothetical protein